jgi:hypothetical protein
VTRCALFETDATCLPKLLLDECIGLLAFIGNQLMLERVLAPRFQIWADTHYGLQIHSGYYLQFPFLN